MNEIYPVELQRTDERELFVRWSDGSEQTIPFRKLRDACQCATCMEKKMGKSEQPTGTLNILSAAEASPLQIESMQPCLLYTSPSPRDRTRSRMPSSA